MDLLRCCIGVVRFCLEASPGLAQKLRPMHARRVYMCKRTSYCLSITGHPRSIFHLPLLQVAEATPSREAFRHLSVCGRGEAQRWSRGASDLDLVPHLIVFQHTNHSTCTCHCKDVNRVCRCCIQLRWRTTRSDQTFLPGQPTNGYVYAFLVRHLLSTTPFTPVRRPTERV